MSANQEASDAPIVETTMETEAVPATDLVTENVDGNEEQPELELTEHEPTIDELKKELAEASQAARDNWEKSVRIQAEMENLKRRTQKDLEDARKYALTSFAKELLPVLDSLILGMQAATGESEEVIKFKEGSELTLKQLEAAFARFNITEINPVGEPFNAEQHQAMVMQVVEGVEPNTVVTVFQKGYLLNGRLLRPAMVVVAKAAD